MRLIYTKVSNAQRREKDKFPFWLWLNITGLDAPIVAVCWQYFFASNYNIKIPFSNYLVLFLVVWVIYSVDRLLDSRVIRNDVNATSRHRFYYQNFKALLFITVIISGLTIVLCLTSIPLAVLKFGITISCLVGVYFIHRKWGSGALLGFIPREVFVGMVFAIGSTLLGHTWTGEVPEAFLSISVIGFGVLCSMNCLAISVWEKEEDSFNDRSALAQLAPKFPSFFPFISVMVFLIMSSVACYLYFSKDFFILLAASSGCGIISIMSFIESKISSRSLRILADVAVIVPALVFLLFV